MYTQILKKILLEIKYDQQSIKFVIFGYAESAVTNPNLIAIVLKMTIDTSVSFAPFDTINEVSYFKMEEEVFFSVGYHLPQIVIP